MHGKIARVCALWNHSFNMHLYCLGSVSWFLVCFFFSQSESPQDTHEANSVANGLMGCSILWLLIWEVTFFIHLGELKSLVLLSLMGGGRFCRWATCQENDSAQLSVDKCYFHLCVDVSPCCVFLKADKNQHMTRGNPRDLVLLIL